MVAVRGETDGHRVNDTCSIELGWVPRIEGPIDHVDAELIHRREKIIHARD